MFTTYLEFAVLPIEITSISNSLSMFASLISDLSVDKIFTQFSCLISSVLCCTIQCITTFFDSFIDGVTITWQVLLSNIADLLNPLTFEENLAQEAREHEYRVNIIKQKLRYQRTYMSTTGNKTYMNIWWRGWNNMPQARLTASEQILLLSLPTSVTYFDNTHYYLYPNRFEGVRPGIRSCPTGSVEIPTTAKLWLAMDEQQP